MFFVLVIFFTSENCSWGTHTHTQPNCLFITVQILLSKFMDRFLVLGIMEQMNKNSIVETLAPFPFTFSLPDLLCSALSFRSSLVWTSPVVSFSYFPFLIIHSPSYLMACDHFPIMSLKKKRTRFSKWACIIKSYETLAGWPGWLSDGANEIQVRGESPYGTVSFFFV